EVLAYGALHALERVCEPLVLECRRRTVVEHDLALGRELTELDHGVADGDEQRHGDERKAHQNHAEQRPRPPDFHSPNPRWLTSDNDLLRVFVPMPATS